MNYGGFSWKRLLGISAFKSRVSRKIGIPLTASGRRRKLGAFVFNAVGPVAGTIAVAAVGATKQRQESNEVTTPSEPPSPKGVYFCEVKAVTHNNDDGTSRIAAQQLCSIGDPVKLVPEPNNEHDRNAIRVLLQTGQQIGYISARQAARFAGKVHLLTATVHSRVKDEWGNDTIKLRVLNCAEQEAHKARSSTGKRQSPSLDPISTVQVIQAEAKETAKKEGWQSTFVYFENADRGLYQIVLAENTEHMRQTLQEGLIRVGFIGGHDAPKGIQFGFVLDDSFPMNGVVAKRFLVNAREWVVTRSKDLCAQKGIAAPIVHDLEFSKQFASAQLEGVTHNVAPSKPGVTSFTFGFVIGIAGLLLALVTGEWRMTLVIVLFAVFTFGGKQGLLRRLTIALVISLSLYQAWWAAGLVTAAAVAVHVWRVSHSADKGAR
jgi:hypothetical protein